MFAERLEQDHLDIDELYRTALTALRSGSRAAALISVDIFWARLAMHIRAEHHHLFHAIEGADETVTRLKADHDQFMVKIASVMKLLRASEADAEPDLHRALEIVQHLGPLIEEHNHLEESTVYGPAADKLTDQQRADLDRSIEKEISRLPPRFESSDGGGND